MSKTFRSHRHTHTLPYGIELFRLGNVFENLGVLPETSQTRDYKHSRFQNLWKTTRYEIQRGVSSLLPCRNRNHWHRKYPRQFGIQCNNLGCNLDSLRCSQKLHIPKRQNCFCPQKFQITIDMMTKKSSTSPISPKWNSSKILPFSRITTLSV